MPRPTRVPDSGRLPDDERGVSVAVNHVLSIGITTILITGLIFAAGNVLEAQRGAATDQELRTIGNRIANQIETAEATAKSNGGTVVLKTDHPDRVTGSKYTVRLSTDCDLGSACLKLSPTSDDKVVEVAIRNETSVIENRVADGTFWISVSQDGITLSSRSPGPVANRFASPTGARVASSADYTGPYGAGSGAGGAGVIGIAPTIESFSATDAGGGKIDVDWNVTDGDSNLEWVNITVREPSASEVNNESFPASGSVYDDSDQFDNGISNGQNYEVIIKVKDADGNVVTDTVTVSL